MRAQKQTLGRGLGALISEDLDRSILREDNERVQKILIQDIIPNPDQPRRQFDEAALNELARSIEQHGVVQPIIVVRHKNQYRIVAGERRWRAAQLAKLDSVPAIIRSMQELEEIELSLIENIQRVDLSPLEQAMSVYKLQQQFNLGLDEIAAKLGKAPSTISNLTRLLQLPDAAREALREGKISEGHARAILSLKGSPDKQEELLRSILDNSWTVRQAEQFATAAKEGADAEAAKNRTASETDLTRRLGQNLGTKVQIKHTARGGQLIIRFNSENHLQEIAKQLSDQAGR
ncbi:MAG TPA: ParB/RepB/Spo0J family partition protein [Candidatus Saccharimonadales bacterium]|nr:ParB/RepB/Spo0J family partition protein [Candidatus Saccharimonadales bacterium]